MNLGPWLLLASAATHLGGHRDGSCQNPAVTVGFASGLLYQHLSDVSGARLHFAFVPKPDHALQQNPWIFNHLVDDGERRGRHGERELFSPSLIINALSRLL
jgi:hypothetical protein